MTADRVSLREVTQQNLQAVLALSVREDQAHLVASNAKSIAEAYFHPEAWFRAIYAGETPVGFLMLHDESLLPEPRQDDFYYLWRFMIDAAHQRKDYGRRALALLLEHVTGRPNAKVLLTSCLPGPGSAEPFYRGFGFEPAGETPGGEIELQIRLP